MTYLVTGATGFIGSYVVEQLLDEDERVVGLDRDPIGALEDVIGERAHEVRLYVGDVTDFPLVARIIQDNGVDRIIHLAGELHARSAEHPGLAVHSNVVGTYHVLEAARLLDVTRVVTASSAAIFGTAEMQPVVPIPNDARLYPKDLYEGTKVLGETMGEFYGRTFGVDNAAIRIGLAYGYGCLSGNGLKLIDELVLKPLRGEPSRVQWGDAYLNWVYVVDGAAAFIAAARATTTDTWAYNLCGDYRTVAEGVQIARELLPDATIEVEPGGHRWAQHFDDSLFRRDTGFTAKYPLEAGIADAIERARR
jgi:nucleoside-diphosphate-sugar epimerase